MPLKMFAVLAVASVAACAHSAPPPVLDEYLRVFEEKSTDHLVLTDDASFFGALLSDPIVGDQEIIAFLNRVLPSLELVEVKQAHQGLNGACAELVFQFGDQDLEEAHCITFEQGAISSIRLYFDPRPLLPE
ncbi:MAG: hypothetical protein AAFU81_02100 [Pseudomonadota bacterium]